MRARMMGIGFALAAVLAAAPLGAAGVRTIATVALDTYFDESFRLRIEDVLLAGINPSFTIEALVAREDTEGWHEWEFGIGPVISFTPKLYFIGLYTLGVSSNDESTHELEVSINYETDISSISLGAKADWFPSSGYYYVMPSFGGKFHPFPALGLFGKAFITFDSSGQASGSFWGEGDWTLSRLIALHAGWTMGYSGNFGWSAIAGINFSFTPKVVLKYFFRYLAEPVENVPGAPVKNGIENGLVLDVKL